MMITMHARTVTRNIAATTRRYIQNRSISVYIARRCTTATNNPNTPCAIHTPTNGTVRTFSTITNADASHTSSSASATSSNPLLRSDLSLPRYSDVEPKHVAELTEFFEEFRKKFVEMEENIEKLLRDPSQLTYHSVVPPVEVLMDRLAFICDTASHLAAVRDSPALREAMQSIQPHLVELRLRIGQSTILYRAFQELLKRTDLSSVERKIVSDNVLVSRLAGVALEGEKKDKFNAWTQRLSQLSTQFSHNVQDATKSFRMTITDPAVMEGATDATLEMFAACARETSPMIPGATAREGPWRLGLTGADMMPFLSFCKSRGHREVIQKAYTSRCSIYDGYDNTQIVAEILLLRQAKASLIGYPSYAHENLSTKMVDSPDAVHAFLEQLNVAARPTAVKELEELQQFAWNDKESPLPPSVAIRPHDVHFYGDRLAKAKLSFDSEALRPYLPFPRVLDGLWKLVDELFDVRVKERPSDEVGPGRAIDTWHADVKYFDVFSPSGELIAGFFVDAYVRPSEKRGGAWMGECVGRAEIVGPDGRTTVRIPVAYLICNQAPPVGDQPSLMSFDELTTLFHEFGHVSQHLLTTVAQSSVAGIRGVEWDAVELASQFLENFAYEPEVLNGLTKHVSTGACLPADMLSSLLASRTFRAASHLIRQIHFAEIDMQLHHAGLKHVIQPILARGGDITPADISSVAAHISTLDRTVAERIAVLQSDPQSRFLTSFSHIWAGGYSAGYYSYKWSEVMSCDAFGAFEEAAAKHSGSPDTKRAAWKSLGRRYKDTVLALGGSKKAKEVFREFRGRDPSIEPLLRQAGLSTNSKAEKQNA